MSLAANTDALLVSDQRIRAAASALGPALAAVEPYVEPALARSVQARENLYDRLEAEHGLLTPAEAGRLMGSTSTAPRNYTNSTHAAGRLLALARNGHALYPGFQFDDAGQPLPVVSELRALAVDLQWSETGVVQWLLAPTTYLDNGDRPVDHLASDPERVLAAARSAWSASW